MRPMQETWDMLILHGWRNNHPSMTSTIIMLFNIYNVNSECKRFHERLGELGLERIPLDFNNSRKPVRAFIADNSPDMNEFLWRTGSIDKALLMMDTFAWVEKPANQRRTQFGLKK